VLGATAVAAFVAVLWVDHGALGRPRDEVSLHVDPAALAEGFREGVQWFGLYRGEHKVGYSRTEQRRRGDGYALSQQIAVRGTAGGRPTHIAIDTELDAAFALERFTVDASLGDGGGPAGAGGLAGATLHATGERRGDVLHVEARGLPGVDALDLPLREPPVFDFSLGPLVRSRDLRPGDRFTFAHVDPLALAPTEGTLEVLGHVEIDVLGERVEALHLRQRIPGAPPLQLWVNPLGEVLQQELPLELLAVREAEAQATYGLLAPTAQPEASP
jgi:hypothetical protein